MVKVFAAVNSLILIFFSFSPGRAQGMEPVIWRFDAGLLKRNQTTLSISATLPPGWHLYSQFLEEGGPIPTRLRFEASDDYIPAGTPREEENAHKFYDELYDMEITWYSEEVSFFQKVRLTDPAVTISGRVEYMMCNDAVCVPGSGNSVSE